MISLPVSDNLRPGKKIFLKKSIQIFEAGGCQMVSRSLGHINRILLVYPVMLPGFADPGGRWGRINNFALIKKVYTFKAVFIGYGLKTGQGVYPGPNFFDHFSPLFSPPNLHFYKGNTSNRNPFSLKNSSIFGSAVFRRGNAFSLS
jgi:hypothetical protein